MGRDGVVPGLAWIVLIVRGIEDQHRTLRRIPYEKTSDSPPVRRAHIVTAQSETLCESEPGVMPCRPIASLESEWEWEDALPSNYSDNDMGGSSTQSAPPPYSACRPEDEPPTSPPLSLSLRPVPRVPPCPTSQFLALSPD